MKKNIKQILEDIYLIDGSLKTHEASLIKIIEQLLASRPDAKIDQNFVSQLKVKLIAESKSLPAPSFNRLVNRLVVFPVLKKVGLGAVAFAAILLLALVGYKESRNNLPIPTPNNNQVSNVKDAGENAFGKIVLANQNQANLNQDAASSELTAQSPQAMGLGGGGTAVKDSTGAVTSMIWPPYGYTTYNFIYRGGDFEIGDVKQAVYRRATANYAGQELTNVINKMKLGPVDLARFQNLEIKSMEISEDKDYGYSLYIDLRQGTFSINMNWEKWPVRENYTPPAQIPADSEIIAMAGKFLSDYGIDMTGYGPGEVMEQDLVYMMKEGVSGSAETVSSDVAQSMPIRYMPNVSVIYPLIIDGQTVYDQSGQKYGITVSVDLGYKKVTNVYNININGFEKSLYSVVTDVNKIIDFAESGGIYGNYGYYSPDGNKTVDIGLGAPKKGLVMMWQYEEGKGMGRELFVPSLLFPIDSGMPQPDYYGKYVVVPLVGEMMKNPNDGIPVPLPMETRPSL